VFAMTEEKRTAQQRKSLELWCRKVAQSLNTAGMDVQHTLAVKEVSIPWSQELVKELLFRPIFKAISGEESTAQADTKQYDLVYHTLVRHMGEKLGVVLPAWPDQWSQSQEFAEKLYKNEQGSNTDG
jgi:hypothetical protein